jgi:hypothetical protein
MNIPACIDWTTNARIAETWSEANETLRVELRETPNLTCNFKIHWKNVDSDVKIRFDNGTILGAKTIAILKATP